MRKRPHSWRRVAGGYTPAERWVVSFEDGSSCFVKAATDDGTAAALRNEYAVYSQIDSSFMAGVIGWDDDGSTPLLLLEDLSEAVWPPPWTQATIDAVLETIARVRRLEIGGLPSIREDQACENWWPVVQAEPETFLSLGLGSAGWLNYTLPALSAASMVAPFDGDEVVHFDVRSDNVCFAGERCVLVDWNFACRGNGDVNIASWLPSLEAEGGPPPESTLPDAGELAAWMSGYWASRAGLAPPPNAPHLRQVQLAQLRSALPWAIRALGLPRLDGAKA
jgi:hypothetical protein